MNLSLMIFRERKYLLNAVYHSAFRLIENRTAKLPYFPCSISSAIPINKYFAVAGFVASGTL